VSFNLGDSVEEEPWAHENAWPKWNKLKSHWNVKPLLD